jgi:hypothetical protein
VPRKKLKRICHNCSQPLEEGKKYVRLCNICRIEKRRECGRRSYYKHQEERIEHSRKWRSKNREYHNAICKVWKDNNPLKLIIKDVKKRAKLKGLEFSLTHEDISIPDVCPILDIPLFRGKGKQTANSPSIDRIDSTKGYTKDNIQIISTKANTIKSNATFSELVLVGNWAQKELEKINAVVLTDCRRTTSSPDSQSSALVG